MFRLLLIAAALGTSAAAVGAGLPQPKVEYSADSIMETEQMTMKSRVYHAADKERREMDAGGMKQVMIMRLDKKVGWMLMPDQHMYMEMNFAQAQERSGDLSDYQIEQSVVGEETVNGHKTTKHKVVVTDKKGNKFGGFMWTTKEGIMVKLDAIAKSGNSKTRMKMDLQNLKIGRQDPKLFEIPAGYNKMDIGGFGTGGGMDMKSLKGMMGR
jgi:hypothetical protein